MLTHLADVVRLVEERPELTVRFSEDIQADTKTGTIDGESGIQLPGISVNPLHPEDWWTRPTVDWVARQLCQYAHLLNDRPKRTAWLVTGKTVGRGPDREPLLTEVVVVDVLDDVVLREAADAYEARFHTDETD